LANLTGKGDTVANDKKKMKSAIVVAEPASAIVQRTDDLAEIIETGEEVVLGRLTYKTRAGQARVAFVPLVRSNDIRDKVPSVYPGQENEPLHVWACELAQDVTPGDETVFSNGEPVAAEKGQLILVYEIKFLRRVFMLAAKRRTAMVIQALNTRRVKSARFKREVEVWEWAKPIVGRLPWNIKTTDLPDLDLADFDADALDEVLREAREAQEAD
jgi:hypothetical protein